MYVVGFFLQNILLKQTDLSCTFQEMEFSRRDYEEELLYWESQCSSGNIFVWPSKGHGDLWVWEPVDQTLKVNTTLFVRWLTHLQRSWGSLGFGTNRPNPQGQYDLVRQVTDPYTYMDSFLQSCCYCYLVVKLDSHLLLFIAVWFKDRF